MTTCDNSIYDKSNYDNSNCDNSNQDNSNCQNSNWDELKCVQNSNCDNSNCDNSNCDNSNCDNFNCDDFNYDKTWIATKFFVNDKSTTRHLDEMYSGQPLANLRCFCNCFVCTLSNLLGQPMDFVRLTYWRTPDLPGYTDISKHWKYGEALYSGGWVDVSSSCWADINVTLASGDLQVLPSLTDPGKARGRYINTVVIDSLII